MQQWITILNTLTLARVGRIIKDREELPYRVRELLPFSDSAQIKGAQLYFKEQTEQAKREGRIVPFERLCEICEYNETVRNTLQLALAVYTFPELKELFRWMGKGEDVTIELAQLLMEEEMEPPSYGEQKRAYELLERVLKPAAKKGPFLLHTFSMDERIYSYLMEEEQLPEELEEFINPEPSMEITNLWFHESQAQELEKYFLKGVQLLQVQGARGCGKRHLVRYLCGKYHFPLLEINGNRLGYLRTEELRQIIWLIKRELLLEECALCIYGIEQQSKAGKGWDSNYLLKEVIFPLQESGYPLFICSDDKTNLVLETDRFMGLILLDSLNRRERFLLWKGFADLWKLEGLGEEILSSKFKLNGEEIRKIASRLAFLQQEEPLTEEIVHKECMILMREQAMGTLKREKCPQTMEELKLPKAQKAMIKNIVSQITYRYQVYDQWGLEKKYPYGKTVSALFTGPAGTGKTMAAHVIANMLGLPLYTVDLSQVVDKYIGETQKRLEEIFQAAERTSSILFFDEADAVFGKRSEVNDSKDRYANAEVAYILQRMEQYDGVVILASNLQKNIDEAFMRRIRYLVHFELPEEEVRKELWKSCFTKEMPKDFIDFDYLAKNFEFSGGAIKNVVLNAVFLAAEENTKVGMSQIIRSIRQEYVKQGKSVFVAEFGPYGYLLQL